MAERRPRVLLVVTLAETGGAQAYVAALAQALRGSFEVVVAAHGDGPLPPAARRAGARFVQLRWLGRSLRPGRDLLALLELVALMRRLRPQVVHANSSKAGVLGRLAALLARVPVRVFTVHGWAFSAHSGVAGRAYRLADRAMSRLTTLTICVAESERRAGLRAHTCRPKRTVVIPNPAPGGLPTRRPAPDGPARLIEVGRLKRPKDPLTLVRAAALLEPGSFSALLVGDGPERVGVEAEARRLGVAGAVRLAGERRDVPELLAGADVFVLASRSEGLPISILEAMGAGLPVVASSVGGVAELVEHRVTGLLVPPADPPALARALGELIRDPLMRSSYGEAGRRRAQELFGFDAFRRSHLHAYRRALVSAGIAPEP
jgi:glycosyltransferase involved in cell wall biosynthesis